MFIYLFNADGSCKIRQLMNPSDVAAKISKLHGDLDFVQTNAVYTPDDMYFKRGRLVFKEPKPSQFHQFDYTLEQWVDPRTEQDHITANRSKRDLILQETVDRINPMRWQAMTVEQQALWTEFRKLLLDITNRPDQRNLTWPIPPL